jgi:endonuclease-3
MAALRAPKKPIAKRRAAAGPTPAEVLQALREAHPDAHCELDHASAFQLLVATVLSAQTTDVAVNKLTPALFAAYPDAKALAAADPADVEQKLSTIGMFRQKTKNVTGLARLLCERHGGEVPRSLEALVALPGVGRKTANVVLGVVWGTPEGVVVDTHVSRLSQRLGFTQETEPEKIEKALCAVLPRDLWDAASHTLIFHGRRVCFARKPACGACTVRGMCPSADAAEEVGRKPPRAPRGAATEKAATTPAKKAKPSKAATAREKATAPKRAATTPARPKATKT